MLVSFQQIKLLPNSLPIVRLLESLHDFYCPEDNLEDLRKIDTVLKQESKRLAEVSKTKNPYEFYMTWVTKTIKEMTEAVTDAKIDRTRS